MTKIEDKEFTIIPDIRTYKMLRDEMRLVYQELCRLRDCSAMDERLVEKLILLSDLFAGLAGEDYQSQLDEEDSLIESMGRE
nr:hypothetical protein [Bifidobacterium magnum]